MALETKFEQNKEDLKQVQDVMLRTKTDLNAQVAEIRTEMSKQTLGHDEVEKRMEKQITDCMFWIEKYTTSFKENDAKMGLMGSGIEGQIEVINYELGKRVTIDDLEKNFAKLNDILLIKFNQVEDNKQTVKDMLNYQKYFYPLQMQAIIGENMMNLETAMNDQGYVKFQQKRYDDLLIELSSCEQRAANS